MKGFISFVAALFLFVPVALAQDMADPVNECETDADCPTQFICTTVEIPCAAMACLCECEPCDPDDSEGCGCVCPACDVAECEGGEYRMCIWEPVDCADDGDCPDGFECVVDEYCEGSIGCECAPCACDPSDDSCDCSDYTCDCPDIVEPECWLGDGYCVPAQVACVADSDCPEGFTCTSFEVGVSCACPDCACMPCEGDACEPCECEPCDCGDTSVSETESYCLPEAWSEYVDYGAGETALEPRQDGDLIAVEDKEDTGAGTNTFADGDAEGAGTTNCSAGRSGTLSWVALLPFVVLLAFRRRQPGR